MGIASDTRFAVAGARHSSDLLRFGALALASITMPAAAQNIRVTTRTGPLLIQRVESDVDLTLGPSRIRVVDRAKGRAYELAREGRTLRITEDPSRVGVRAAEFRLAREGRTILLVRVPSESALPETARTPMAEARSGANSAANPDRTIVDPSVERTNGTAARISRPESFWSAGDPMAQAAALDQVAEQLRGEIGTGRLLIVWLLDASPTLRVQRLGVAERIERLYGALAGRADLRPGALEMVVGSVGQSVRFVVDAPTGDPARLRTAIEAIESDETGIENLFRAVSQTALKFGRAAAHQQRSLMIVLVTDEAGDDQEKLETAISMVRRYEIPVLVVGPNAAFGRSVIYSEWTDPDTGASLRIPQSRGPSTRRLEVLAAPFRTPPIGAGFGPFALSRLAHESRGGYFVLDDELVPPLDLTQDLAQRYRPNYGSVVDYLKEINESPIRRALMATVAESTRRFKAPGPDETVRARRSRRDIDRLADHTDSYLRFAEAALPTLDTAERYRELESSLRWRANFDLAYARLLLGTARCRALRRACRRFADRPPSIPDSERFNGWRLEWTDTDTAKSAEGPTTAESDLLERARAHYGRVIDQHPGTAWAKTAQRERRKEIRVDWIPIRLPGDAARERARRRAPKR